EWSGDVMPACLVVCRKFRGRDLSRRRHLVTHGAPAVDALIHRTPDAVRSDMIPVLVRGDARERCIGWRFCVGPRTCIARYRNIRWNAWFPLLKPGLDAPGYHLHNQQTV